jgi:hypothetical protein
MRFVRRRAAPIIAVCGALTAANVSSALATEEIVPLAGCYERIYDAASMKAHPRQIVQRVTLLVRKTAVPETPGEKQPIVADAFLAIWVGRTAFSSIGACFWERVGLVCNASLSAIETRRCKTTEDGLHDCRLPGSDSGAFEIAQKPEGLLLSIRERLELPGPLDGVQFLYLSPDNADNHAFLLRPAPEASCK